MKRRVMMEKKKLQLFTKRFFPAGTYTWVVPKGCTEVDVFLVGAGGGCGVQITNFGFPGGAGGGFTKSYRGKGYVKPSAGTWVGSYNEGRDGDAITVYPGQQIQIVVGAGTPGGNGGFSQFMDSRFRAEGGYASTQFMIGSKGGSGGGTANDNGPNYGDGGSDGSDGGNNPGSGQGHTTRDFGEPDGKRNAGGGSSVYDTTRGRNSPGKSDYTEGSGFDVGGSHEKWRPGLGGGGYGGGAGTGNDGFPYDISAQKGGDGTVLIRYYAYEEY